MKAIVIEADSRLVWGDAAEVEIVSPGDVLVETRASAVNRADLLQAAGHYPPPPGASPVLGLEVSGEILEVGSDVKEWNAGDRVCALLSGGGYAERVVVPQGLLLRLPDSWSYEMGAAIPEVWLTAFLNLFGEGQLQPDESALIHAGASGVGTAGIQMAAAAGARVFATAGSDEKVDRCLELGAELAVNYRKNDFVAAVIDATGGEGVHLILDPVGADYFMRNLKALRTCGRMVMIGLLSGGSAEVNLGLILGKRIRLIGSTLRTRPTAEKIAITEEFRNRFWPGLQSGELKPVIDTVFPMPQAQAAHDYVGANRNTGKVILSLE